MNYSTAIFLINKAVRAVKVSYDQDKAQPWQSGGQSATLQDLRRHAREGRLS
jgi:hypothetical protein